MGVCDSESVAPVTSSSAGNRNMAEMRVRKEKSARSSTKRLTQFRMSISPQLVIQSTSCLVLVDNFHSRRIIAALN